MLITTADLRHSAKLGQRGYVLKMRWGSFLRRELYEFVLFMRRHKDKTLIVVN